MLPCFDSHLICMSTFTVWTLQAREVSNNKLAPTPYLSCASYFSAGWEKGIAAVLTYLFSDLCYNMYAKLKVCFL